MLCSDPPCSCIRLCLRKAPLQRALSLSSFAQENLPFLKLHETALLLFFQTPAT